MDIFEQFALDNTACWLCGRRESQSWIGLETHHIVRGSVRSGTKKDRRVFIRTCHQCHESRLDSMPVVQQLAIKLMFDNDYYDPEFVNISRRRSRGAVTHHDVLEAVATLMLNAMKTHGTIYPFSRID